MDSENIIRFRNDLVATSDIFNTLCGSLMGEGIGRVVFEHQTDEKLVVKIAYTPNGVIANSNEFQMWEEIKHLNGKHEWVKEWFAPVHFLSENSNVLIMSKTEEKPNKKRPQEIPSFLYDAHYNNMGWIGNKFVCHDYGNIYGFIKYNKKFKKLG